MDIKAIIDNIDLNDAPNHFGDQSNEDSENDDCDETRQVGKM